MRILTLYEANATTLTLFSNDERLQRSAVYNRVSRYATKIMIFVQLIK